MAKAVGKQRRIEQRRFLLSKAVYKKLSGLLGVLPVDALNEIYRYINTVVPAYINTHEAHGHCPSQ